MYRSVGAKTLETGEERKTMPEDETVTGQDFLRQFALEKERKRSSKLSSSWDNPFKACMRPQVTENEKIESTLHRGLCVYTDQIIWL